MKQKHNAGFEDYLVFRKALIEANKNQIQDESDKIVDTEWILLVILQPLL